MRVPIYTRRALCAAVAALAVVGAAGCSYGGTKLDFTVAATATDSGTRDTSATVDPDGIATAWAEVDDSDRPSCRTVRSKCSSPPTTSSGTR